MVLTRSAPARDSYFLQREPVCIRGHEADFLVFSVLVNAPISLPCL